MKPTAPDGLIVDFAIVLHSFSAQLENVLEWLEPIAGTFSENPFPLGYDVLPEHLEQALEQPIKALVSLLEEADEDAFADQDAVDKLRNARSVFSRYLSAPLGKRVRAPYLHDQLEQLQILTRDPYDPAGSRPKLGSIAKSASRIRRILYFYDLSGALDTVREMKDQALALREFYVNSTKSEESFEIVPLSTILNTAVRQNTKFADSRDVEIRLRGTMSYMVNARKRVLTRALYNIIRNAVKYNYRLAKDPVWVDVRCFRKHGWTSIEVENWGVPITIDELETGRIFHPGIRGTYARLSGKPGHGIGLAEAKDILQDHGGSISIESKPSRPNAAPTDYSQPFITIVSIRLPEISQYR